VNTNERKDERNKERNKERRKESNIKHKSKQFVTSEK
jgi:hypothetical protein